MPELHHQEFLGNQAVQWIRHVDIRHAGEVRPEAVDVLPSYVEDAPLCVKMKEPNPEVPDSTQDPAGIGIGQRGPFRSCGLKP